VDVGDNDVQGRELQPVYGGFGEGGDGSEAEGRETHESSLSALGLYTPYGRKTLAGTEAELKRRLLEVFPAARRGRGQGHKGGSGSSSSRRSGTHIELYNLKDDLVLDSNKVGTDIHQFHTRQCGDFA
jgi:hypothetical protein